MQEGSEQSNQTLVPMGASTQPRKGRGVACVVLGCLLQLVFPIVGPLVCAYGMRELIEALGGRGLALAMVICVACAAGSLALGLSYASALVTTACACAGTSWCVARKATVTSISLVACVVTALALGIDAIYAATAGTTLRALATTSFGQAASSAFGTGVEAELLADRVTQIAAVMWPVTYLVWVLIDIAAAGAGSFFASLRWAAPARPPSITRFDAPLWSVVVLAVSLVGIGASRSDIPGATTVLTCSVTALMGVRFIFALQGIGVVTALCERAQLGCFGRTVCIFIACWLEVMFFIMSIVGLVDVWANFRALPRQSGSRSEAQQ